MSKYEYFISHIQENTQAYGIAFLAILTLVVFLIWNSIIVPNYPSSELSKINSLYPTINGNIRSLNNSYDLSTASSSISSTSNIVRPSSSYFFRDYYIKTAFNCCSGGSYSNDYVNPDIIKALLRQGVRGYDMEIFSIEDMPVVATSTGDNYFVKETYNSVPFDNILQIIETTAFRIGSVPNPDDPIILHIRFKSSNQNMYTNLAKLLEKYDSILLGKEYSYEYQNKNLGGVPILKFRKKVIIICDINNPSFLECKEFHEYVNMTSNSIFMRALRYYDVAYSPNIDELTSFNKQSMTICMPDVGSNPPNPSSLLARTLGCQLIAMRYQLNDTYLQENENFFNTEGFSFVLKPENLRYVPVVVEIPDAPPESQNYAPRDISARYYQFQI